MESQHAKTILASIRDFYEMIFHDHSESRGWDNISEITFFDRRKEQVQLIRACEEAFGKEKNILVVGKAGVGKTAILKRIAHN